MKKILLVLPILSACSSAVENQELQECSSMKAQNYANFGGTSEFKCKETVVTPKVFRVFTREAGALDVKDGVLSKDGVPERARLIAGENKKVYWFWTCRLIEKEWPPYVVKIGPKGKEYEYAMRGGIGIECEEEKK